MVSGRNGGFDNEPDQGKYVFYDAKSGGYVERDSIFPADDDGVVKNTEANESRTPCIDYGDDAIVGDGVGPDPTEYLGDDTTVLRTQHGEGGGMLPPEDGEWSEYGDEGPERGGHRGRVIAGIVLVALVAGGVGYAENIGGFRGGSGGDHALLPPATSTSAPRSTAPATHKKNSSPTSSTSHTSKKPTHTSTSKSSSPTSSATSSATKSTKPAPVTQESCVAKLPLNWRVNQTLTVGADAVELGPHAVGVLEKNNIGGVVVMSQPTTQIGYDALKSLDKANIFVGTDQEGGTVQRFKDPNLANGKLPSAQEAARTMSPSEYEALIKKDMTYLKSRGVNTVYAPVADVAPANNQSTEGPTRQFSNDPSIVTKYVQAYIDGAKAAGVNAVMKHFPGMGRASANTDFGAATTPPLSSLKKIDWQPYENVKNKTDQDVMVGTPVVPDWGKLPAALVSNSYEALDDMGYTKGVKWTDSLNTRAAGGKSQLSGALAATGLTLPQVVATALESGATEEMFVGTHPNDANFSDTIATIDKQVAADIKSGKFSEKQLNRAVLTDLGAKGINACKIAPAK